MERKLVANPFDLIGRALPVGFRMFRTNPVVRMHSNILYHRGLCSDSTCIGCPLDNVYHVHWLLSCQTNVSQRVELVTVTVAVLCCTIPETWCGSIVGFA